MFHVAVNLYLWICILALNYLKSSAASNRETLILQVVFRLLRRVFSHHQFKNSLANLAKPNYLRHSWKVIRDLLELCLLYFSTWQLHEIKSAGFVDMTLSAFKLFLNISVWKIEFQLVHSLVLYKHQLCLQRFL